LFAESFSGPGAAANVIRCGGKVGDGDGDALRSGVGERPGGSGLPDGVGVGDGPALGVALGDGVAVGTGVPGSAEPLATAPGDGGAGPASCLATSSLYVLFLSAEL
jgi:hypothetical protein